MNSNYTHVSLHTSDIHTNIYIYISYIGLFIPSFPSVYLKPQPENPAFSAQAPPSRSLLLTKSHGLWAAKSVLVSEIQRGLNLHPGLFKAVRVCFAPEIDD